MAKPPGHETPEPGMPPPSGLRGKKPKPKGKRRVPRGKPSKPGPLSTDVSPLFKDKY
jgi:hypothetical protein